MILSHKYKFIFIKTNKTAGTSIEIALSKFCGKDDIITPLPFDEEIRKELGYRGPQNYQISWPWEYSRTDAKRLITKGIKKTRFYGHMSAAEIKALVGDEVWSSYFKFCFERNPFERVISQYYYRFKEEPRPSLDEFLDSKITLGLKARGVSLYTIDGEVVVDRVCLYENLQEELERVRVALGMPQKLELPAAKGGFRKDKRSYREILRPDQIARIGQLFEQEISRYYSHLENTGN